MKKTITAMALLAGAVTGFSQGQIQMFDYGGSFAIQVFAKSTTASPVSVTYGGYTVSEEQGNTSANDNPGASTYSGAPLGSGYDIELLAGPSGTALAQLLPVSGSLVTSWLTGGGAGYWNAPTLIATIPSVTSTAAVAIAAWAATGVDGAATTLAAAQADDYAWGISAPATTSALGFGSITPPVLPAGLTSFSINTSVPEPSTVALGVIGASSFLMRLRRKK
jgi:hypothetical protein